MGSMSIWHWVLLGAVVLLLFGGKGKISDIMGDVAKGVKSFKKGLAHDDEKPAEPAESAALDRESDRHRRQRRSQGQLSASFLTMGKLSRAPDVRFDLDDDRGIVASDSARLFRVHRAVRSARGD